MNFAQDSITETERLSATAKVWGFLKYYHPIVASGKFDWDQELFRILPKVKKAQSKESLSEILLDWIEELGPVKHCKKCDSKNNLKFFDRNLDLSWIQNKQLFTSELTDKLKFIENNRHQGEKHYVDYYKGEPKMAYFRNEIEYPNFDWQNEELRLLCLFRYWNMVAYFFPAKYQMEKNWSNVLDGLIPKFYNPKSKDEYHQALVELVVSLDDSHALIYPNSEFCNFGCYIVPFEFIVIDDSAIITRFYDRELAELDDLKIGDIITNVDGQNIYQNFEANEKYIHGSNISRKKLNAGYYLLNGSTPSVNVQITSKGKTSSKTLKRYLYKDINFKINEQTEKYRSINDSIGYIDIGKVETNEVPKVMEAFEDTKAIIFDIRRSKGSTPYYFANYISSQKKDFYKAIYPDLNYPGRYIWSEDHQSGNNQLKYTGKVILLVDESCQSQMEFTAMCLQIGDNVTTIGRQTSGANGNVIRFKMVGGLQTQMTGIGIFYPNGQEAQRNGVKIDIEVNPSPEAIIDGRDEILERAIEYINE
ncbi:C-terminal processing protease CtpA/Prc, contains a PDZ domain [Muriicola jejuensis]|nr:C-terminal processing protease CtpA/Prc, contains a PDZ domain [Muriicola jejuensis]